MAFSLRYSTFLRKKFELPKFVRNTSTCPAKKGLVLGVYENENCISLTETADRFNKTISGKLEHNLNLVGEIIKAGKSYLFWGISPDFPAVTVVGLGKKNIKYDSIEQICEEKEAVRIAAAVGCKKLSDAGIKDINVESFGDPESAAEGSILSTWKFQEFKTKKKTLPCVNLYTGGDDCNTKAWERGVIKANAQNLARKLADTPANHMTPQIFCEEVRNLFSDSKTVTVIEHDEKWAQEQNMCSFLAVSKGSCEPPRFLELTYCCGEKDDPPFVLVGKGVTFDSGGISIKPSANMDEMRADMTGAAVIVSTLHALACLNVNANIKVLIPLCENMPSDKAVKPGDVIRAKNGKTICVDNTDAEGRLILADALCYSAEFKPKWVLDMATLTGAMRVALGNSATGVFSNSDKLYETLRDAGTKTGDRVWRFPLWKHFSKQVTDYPAFDVNNVGKGKGGGSCTAAAFLKEFVPECTDWMHLDIASVMGPAESSPYLGKGMSGRPTRTLIEFVEASTKNTC